MDNLIWFIIATLILIMAVFYILIMATIILYITKQPEKINVKIE